MSIVLPPPAGVCLRGPVSSNVRPQKATPLPVKSPPMRSTPIRTNNPRYRRRAQWPNLSRAELRLLMSGLANWEARSTGQVRSRIRRKRLEAVAFFRKHHGPLANDRMWVGVKAAQKEQAPHRLASKHDPKKEDTRGILWHEA